MSQLKLILPLLLLLFRLNKILRTNIYNFLRKIRKILEFVKIYLSDAGVLDDNIVAFGINSLDRNRSAT